jgi:hypothetical protein
MVYREGQYQAGAHEERARNHHRARTDAVGDVARGGAEQKIDECGYRKDRRNRRAAGTELGSHRHDEGAEAVDHRERREHREKRGERDHPGLRRIRLGRQDARKCAGGPGLHIWSPSLGCGAHRATSRGATERRGCRILFTPARAGKSARLEDASLRYNPGMSRSVKCDCSIPSLQRRL